MHPPHVHTYACTHKNTACTCTHHICVHRTTHTCMHHTRPHTAHMHTAHTCIRHTTLTQSHQGSKENASNRILTRVFNKFPQFLSPDKGVCRPDWGCRRKEQGRKRQVEMTLRETQTHRKAGRDQLHPPPTLTAGTDSIVPRAAPGSLLSPQPSPTTTLLCDLRLVTCPLWA